MTLLLSLGCWLFVLLINEGDSRCDFHEAVKRPGDPSSSSSFSLSWSEPVIFRGFLDHWPRGSEGFISKYGDIKIHSGSESSIVYSHGTADGSVLLSDLLDISPENYSETFSFDMNVLKNNKEIREKYSTPPVLDDTFGSPLVSPVLSVGFLHTGLPLHAHGDAYLGLISGQKRWFLYPPGFGPPRQLQKEWNPFLPVKNWLQQLALVDTSYFEIDDVDELGSPLLICDQLPGEAVYVPAGWSHATYNSVGDGDDDEKSPIVIGIGRQSTWLAEEREQHSRLILLRHPRDFEALKAVATSIFHKAFPASGAESAYRSIKLEVALEEAVSLLMRAVEIRPKFPEVRILLVVILFRRGESYQDEALAEVRALEMMLDGMCEGGEGDNFSIESSVTFGGESESAPQAVDPSQDISSRGIASALYRLSLPLSSQGLLEDALRLLEKSIHLDSHNAKAHAQRILLYEKIGSYTRALEALQDMRLVTASGDKRGQQMLEKIKSYILGRMN